MARHRTTLTGIPRAGFEMRRRCPRRQLQVLFVLHVPPQHWLLAVQGWFCERQQVPFVQVA
jgi:hypothetical protein